VRDADIHLQGGKVAAVSAAGSRLTVPPGTAELDVQQRIVTPGIVSACQCLVYVLCTLLLPLWSKSQTFPTADFTPAADWTRSRRHRGSAQPRRAVPVA
jgi:hypothetical protein